jgi:tetratricopeptide (TPR) repeat protein
VSTSHSSRALIATVICVTAAIAQSGSTLYEQAASYIQRGQASRAITLLKPAIQQNPQDLKAQTLMGMALAADNRREEANQHFRQALAANPRFAPALRNLAINEMALGDAVNARKHFEHLLEMTPADPLAHLALGELEFAAKNFQGAASHFEQSQDLYARDPRDTLKFAEAYIHLKQPDKAASVLQRLPKEAEAAMHFAAGGLWAQLARYADAAREFELAKGGSGVDPYDTGFNLMLAYEKAGDHAAALRTGEDLIQRGFRRAELYSVMSQAYEGSGNTLEAYNALRTATQIDPKDPRNYLDLIALCIDHKNYDLALEIADIGLGRLPDSYRLRLQRGIVIAMKGEFDRARVEFESALKLAPDKSLPYVSLGLVLMQMDKTAEATKVLRERVRADNNDYLALWFLGEALNRSGVAPDSPEEDEAVKALTRSVELKPDIPQSRALLGKLLARRGEYDLAAKHLNKALELDPENVAAMYQLAQVYQRKGDSARAKQLFAKVGKLKAEDREQFTRGGLQQIVRAGAQ